MEEVRTVAARAGAARVVEERVAAARVVVESQVAVMVVAETVAAARAVAVTGVECGGEVCYYIGGRRWRWVKPVCGEAKGRGWVSGVWGGLGGWGEVCQWVKGRRECVWVVVGRCGASDQDMGSA